MKKEYFTIPNLMGYFRILLIPVFCVLYYHSENAGCFYGAVIVLCLSFLSDFFDGKIARHFHQVTEWGKMLDPIADKLTQAALAIMCTVHFPATIWLFLLSHNHGDSFIYLSSRKYFTPQEAGCERSLDFFTEVMTSTSAVTR